VADFAFLEGKAHIPTLRELEEAYNRRVLTIEPNQARGRTNRNHLSRPVVGLVIPSNV